MWDSYLKLMPKAILRTIDQYGSECLFDGPAVYNPRALRWQPGRDGVNQVTLGLTSAKPDGRVFNPDQHFWIRPDMDLSFSNDILETMKKYNDLMNLSQGITSDGGTTVAPTPMLRHNKIPGQPDAFDPTGVVPGRPDITEHFKEPVNTPYEPPSAARSQTPVVIPQPSPIGSQDPQRLALKAEAESLRAQAQKMLDAAAKLEKA